MSQLNSQLRLVTSRNPGLTAIDLAMMDRAIELAEQAGSIGEVPVGAVIYRGNEIIAEAANTREFDRDPCGHAEFLAIRAAAKRIQDWRLSECSLAVTLEPCTMCAGAIVNARVGRVIYGATDAKAGACESLYRITSDERLNHRPFMYTGIKADRCATLLRDFFKKLREDRKAAKRASA
jgi:tRNA(Arg) A34 adenosine deaminase TadA